VSVAQTAESLRQAKVAQISDRAKAIHAVPYEQRRPLVDAFLSRHPDAGRVEPGSWQALRREEQYQIEQIAESAAHHIFGVNGLESLSPRVVADLEQGAAYLSRRVHPEFIRAAQAWAVETLLRSNSFAALCSGRFRSDVDREALALQLVTEVRMAYHGVLEATTPIAPSLYLQCAKAATERGTR
jgi:hypothetical protein